jgi:hypothetical protein
MESKPDPHSADGWRAPSQQSRGTPSPRGDASDRPSDGHTRRPRHTSGRGQAGRPADRGGRLFSCTVALKPETTVAYLDGELDMSTAVSHDPFGPLAKAGSDIIVNLSGVR